MLEHLIAPKTYASHSMHTFIASLNRISGELWNQAQPGRVAAKNVIDVDEWDMRRWVDFAFLGSFGFRWTIIMTKVTTTLSALRSQMSSLRSQLFARCCVAQKDREKSPKSGRLNDVGMSVD